MRFDEDDEDYIERDDDATAAAPAAARLTSADDVADLFDFLAKSAWREVALLHAEADADGDAFYAAAVRERELAVRDGSWTPLRTAGDLRDAADGPAYLVALLADGPAEYRALVGVFEDARDAPGARVLAVEGAGETLLTLGVRVRADDPHAARRVADAAVAGATARDDDEPPGYVHPGEPERAG